MQTDMVNLDPYNGNLDIDAVDWTEVARAYKLLCLSPIVAQGVSADLEAQYLDWFCSSVGRPEFEIALQMALKESMDIELKVEK